MSLDKCGIKKFNCKISFSGSILDSHLRIRNGRLFCCPYFIPIENRRRRSKKKLCTKCIAKQSSCSDSISIRHWSSIHKKHSKCVRFLLFIIFRVVYELRQLKNINNNTVFRAKSNNVIQCGLGMKRRRVVKYNLSTAISGASLFAPEKQLKNRLSTETVIEMLSLATDLPTIWKVKVQTTFDGTHKGRMSNHSKLISLHIVTNYIIYLLDEVKKKRAPQAKYPSRKNRKRTT